MAEGVDMGVVYNTFSTQLGQLSEQMYGVSDKLGVLGSSIQIQVYEGNPKQFLDWIKCIEKQAMLDNLNDERVKRLAFRTSRGAVSDFIQRFLTEHQDRNWAQLKAELTTRFAEVSDQMHAFTLLRSVKQNAGESVQIYAERLLALGKDSFPDGTDAQTIERQLVGFFVDGLSQDYLKMKLLRENPNTFNAAVNSAMQEQNLRKRFNLRTGAPRETHVRDERNLEPMEINHLRPRSYHNDKNRRNQNNTRSHTFRNRAHIRAVDNRRQGNSGRENVQCWYCWEWGHYQRDCTKRPARLN